MRTLTLQLGLKPAQAKVFQNEQRFTIVVAGRRWGKTWTAVWWLVVNAFGGSGRICYYVAPNYRQAKRIAWDILNRMIPAEARRSTSRMELSIELHNGSKIQLHGADRPDSLRGVG